jgi:hypothetical protein
MYNQGFEYVKNQQGTRLKIVLYPLAKVLTGARGSGLDSR